IESPAQACVRGNSSSRKAKDLLVILVKQVLNAAVDLETGVKFVGCRGADEPVVVKGQATDWEEGRSTEDLIHGFTIVDHPQIEFPATIIKDIIQVGSSGVVRSPHFRLTLTI